jgi:hypothetical protein
LKIYFGLLKYQSSPSLSTKSQPSFIRLQRSFFVEAIFGYIIGIVFGRIESVFSMMNRQPTQEELNEMTKAINKRFIEIESRINETFT